MVSEEVLFWGLGIGFSGLLVSIINAIYFHFRYQKKIDETIAGKEDDIGFLIGMTRLMMYGHYCLFPKRARRAGVYNIFTRLPRIQRAHLIFHWLSILLFSFITFGFSVLVER